MDHFQVSATGALVTLPPLATSTEVPSPQPSQNCGVPAVSTYLGTMSETQGALQHYWRKPPDAQHRMYTDLMHMCTMILRQLPFNPSRDCVICEPGLLPSRATAFAERILIDRLDILDTVPLRPGDMCSPLWPSLKEINVHIPTALSRPLNWRDPPAIEDDVVNARLFGHAKSVFIPLRDEKVVDRVWDILKASDDSEATRLRMDLEHAVATVLGPAGCRKFSCMRDNSCNWAATRQDLEQQYWRMQYRRLPIPVPCPESWTLDPQTGQTRPAFVTDEFLEALGPIPRIREVMCVCRPGLAQPKYNLPNHQMIMVLVRTPRDVRREF